jgi:hypothetical protein
MFAFFIPVLNIVILFISTIPSIYAVQVILARSSVVLESRLDLPVDVRLEFPNSARARLDRLSLAAGAKFYVPVHCASSVLKLRPHATGYDLVRGANAYWL